MAEIIEQLSYDEIIQHGPDVSDDIKERLKEFLEKHNAGDFSSITKSYNQHGQPIVTDASMAHYAHKKPQSRILTDNWEVNEFDPKTIEPGHILLLANTIHVTEELYTHPVDQKINMPKIAIITNEENKQETIAALTNEKITSILIHKIIDLENPVIRGNKKDSGKQTNFYTAWEGTYIKQAGSQYALYLGEDNYLSKKGARGKLFISSLAELQDIYSPDVNKNLGAKAA